MRKSRAPVNPTGGQFFATDNPTRWLTGVEGARVRGVFLSDTEKDPKLQPLNSARQRPYLTRRLKSLGSEAIGGGKLARVLSRAISRSVLLGELTDQLRKF